MHKDNNSVQSIIALFDRSRDKFLDLTDIHASNIYCDNFSLEYPLFSVSTVVKETLEFDVSNMKVVLSPNTKHGMATMYDKQIWLYIFSKCVTAYENDGTLTPYITFSAYDCFKFISNTTRLGDNHYKRLNDALHRLKTTEVSLLGSYGEDTIDISFSYIDLLLIHTRKKQPAKYDETTGKKLPIKLEKGEVVSGMYYVKLGDYALELISKSTNHMSLHADYFKVNSNLKRRFYEISLKRCGGNRLTHRWGIDLLQQKVGSTASTRSFIGNVNKNTGDCLNFSFRYDRKQRNFVTDKKSNSRGILLEHYSRTELEAMGIIHPKDSAKDVLMKIEGKYYVIDLYPCQTVSMRNRETYPTTEDIVKYEKKQKKIAAEKTSEDVDQEEISLHIEEKLEQNEIDFSISNIIANLSKKGNINSKKTEVVAQKNTPIENVVESDKNIDALKAMKDLEAPLLDLSEELYIRDTVLINEPDHALSKWYKSITDQGYVLIANSKKASPVDVVLIYKDYCCDVFQLNRSEY